MPARQLPLFQGRQRDEHRLRREHGGTVRLGRRKLARPVDPKRPMHLVLRSTRAKGAWSFLHPEHEETVKRLVRRLAYKNAVQIMEIGNAGNHLHLLVKAKTREGFQSFLRTLTGLLARQITGARKGHAQGKFWDTLAYTRVVSWGRELFEVRYYVIRNQLEGMKLPIASRKEKGRQGSTSPPLGSSG